MVVVAALSALTPVVAFSNFKSTGVSATGDQTVIVNPFNVEISRFSTAKLTPAKPALAGTTFSATVAESLAPDASGFAITCVADPLKSLNTGN